MSRTDPRRARARRSLLVIVLLFVAPIVLAWAMYLGARYWRPFGTIEHGELITPVRALDGSALEAAGGGTALGAAPFRGHWTLVVLGTPRCGDGCRQALYETRQARLALGKDMPRVERYLILGPAPEPLPEAALLGQHPELRVVRAGREWLRRLTAAPATDAAGSIYLIDPQANLMMVYPPQADASGLLDDMQRLLRISRTG